MRAQEFISEKKASAKTCRRGKDGKRISASMASSCKAQGLWPAKLDIPMALEHRVKKVPDVA
jgi:hypothetical protein